MYPFNPKDSRLQIFCDTLCCFMRILRPHAELHHQPEVFHFRKCRIRQNHGEALKNRWALSSLSGLDLVRVTAANGVYSFTALACIDLDAFQKVWSVENPGSSLMWLHPDMLKLATLPSVIAVAFHTCMYGAERRKETAIWANAQEFKAMERSCDDNHYHLPWGLTSGSKRTFATTEECAYNKQLAAAWADVVVVSVAINRGLSPQPNTMLDVTPQHSRQQQVTNKAVLGMLPRGKNHSSSVDRPHATSRSILPESIDPRTLTVGARIPDSKFFPAGTKLLRLIAFDKKGGDDEKAISAVLGIPRDPLDYLAEVCKLVHPVVQQMRVPEVITLSMKMSAAQVAELRAKWAKQELWTPSENWLMRRKSYTTSCQLMLRRFSRGSGCCSSNGNWS